jgi:2-hydroxychromene-2-carboxylate isomerase
MVMKMPQPEFHFDFGSPNAYLSHVLLPGIEARTGARFIYVPVLLGGVFKLTNNQSPMAAFGGVRNKLVYQQVEMERFVTRHNISQYRFNPHFPVNTLLAMRGAVAAGLAGVLTPYVNAVFSAMWEQQAKLDDADVLRGVLETAGLDGAALLARTQEPAVKDALMRNTSDSVERGNFGSPTFFVGSDMYFGKDRLAELEEALTSK